jgi:hypothetical protein
MGLVFSFSGFNEFRLGMGIFFGKLGSDGGHHPFGDDFGLLFEYNLKDNIGYNRFYYHFTGGASAFLLGGSMVIVSDKNNINVGFAPEIGIGLSTLFKTFYRYNFYVNNNRFNSYEIVFHLCLYIKIGVEYESVIYRRNGNNIQRDFAAGCAKGMGVVSA